MLKTNKKTVEIDAVCGIVCNKCEEEYFVNENGMSEFEGMGEVTFTFGYFSKYFGDGTEISFSLCEKCLCELVNSFKVEAITEERW